MRTTTVALLTLSVSLVGCGPPMYMPPERSSLTRSATVVSAPYDSTWAVVVSYFSDHNIPIRTIEKASGIIVAEAARADLLPNRSIAIDEKGNHRFENGKAVQGPPVYAMCGTFMQAQLDPQSAAFNVRVQGDASRSTVRVNVRYVSSIPQFGSPVNATVECTSTGKWETELEATVKQSVEHTAR